MKLNTNQKISVGYIFVMIFFWLTLVATHTTIGKYNFLFSFLMGVLPFIGGIVAIRYSQPFHGLRGFISKGIFFLGLGLLCWGCGELIWSYYNFFVGISAPYPSWADLGFAPSVFFYCIGVVCLVRAGGADLGLKKKFTKLFIIIVSLITFPVAYYLFVVVARQGVLYTSGDPVLKSILDIAYPLDDFISLVVAIVVSGLAFRSIMSKYKAAVVTLLLGLAIMITADSTFSYTTTRGTYFNGDFGDLLFTLGLFFLTFGVLAFCEKENQSL